MSSLFHDVVALVTGGTSGSGRATAIAFSRHGARVVVAGRRKAEGAETVRLIESAGGTAMSIPTDVSDLQAVESLIAKMIDHYGSLSFAFNNAGIEGSISLPITTYSEATWDEVLGTNIKGCS